MFVKFADLPVFDQDRAIAFYARIGCTVARDAPYAEGGWRWVELAMPGARTRLLFTRREDDAPSDAPALVLVDEAIDALFERLGNEGTEIVAAPRQAPWEPGARFGEFRDSEGNRIVVSSA